jgi:hypothetical protein
VNSTVIAGALILLTLTYFGTGFSELQNRFYIYYYTAFIIVPLSASCVLIIVAGQEQHRLLHAATSLSTTGFIVLALFVAYIAFLSSPLAAKDSIAVQCAIEPRRFNISEPVECTRFLPGSLAEQCAIDPKKFSVKLEQCQEFAPEK